MCFKETNTNNREKYLGWLVSKIYGCIEHRCSANFIWFECLFLYPYVFCIKVGQISIKGGIL